MSRLLGMQKEDPIEYTHYDCWLGADCEYEELSTLDDFEICEDIIKSWETSLGLSLHPSSYNNAGILNLYATLGIAGVLDLVVLRILESQKYDVYSSDTCIEIYPTKDFDDDEEI